MKLALIALVILTLSQPSFGEFAALSVHLGKVEGPGFQKRDMAVVLEAESIIGPSVIAVEAMVVGNPIARSPGEQTTFKSITMGSRLIVGPHVCRISAGVGAGIAEKETATVSPQGHYEKRKQQGLLYLGVLELRVATKKGSSISIRVTRLRTRLSGGELAPVLAWKSAILYTIGWIAEFG